MYTFNVGAEKLGIAENGGSPADSVADNRLHVRIVEYGECLVSRLEVEYPAVAAVEGTARAEDLAALVPAHKDDLVGLGDTEGLGVGFDTVKLKISADAKRYRVRGVDRPNAL